MLGIILLLLGIIALGLAVATLAYGITCNPEPNRSPRTWFGRSLEAENVSGYQVLFFVLLIAGLAMAIVGGIFVSAASDSVAMIC